MALRHYTGTVIESPREANPPVIAVTHDRLTGPPEFDAWFDSIGGGDTSHYAIARQAWIAAIAWNQTVQSSLQTHLPTHNDKLWPPPAVRDKHRHAATSTSTEPVTVQSEGPEHVPQLGVVTAQNNFIRFNENASRTLVIALAYFTDMVLASGTGGEDLLSKDEAQALLTQLTTGS